MAHHSQNVFFRQVRQAFPDHFQWANVLEVGSLDINGSIRDLFEYCNYVGVDVGPGPGVDFAVPGQEVAYPDESFDITVSAECFEHNPYWAETFENMKRMTKVGGIIAFTCAGKDRPEHGTSRTDAGSSPLTVGIGWEYYRNLEESDFTDEHLKGLDYQFFYNPQACDLYFVAKRTSKNQPGRKFANIIEEVDWNN
jgi:SAM-dependent methyltransferase